jgi:CMP-N,N'-diacetyllegionaminic acid synthase
MYKGKRILAIIPARGGSKGIPLKNLITINGESLIKKVSSVVRQTGVFDDSVISTDHPLIANDARSNGLSFYSYRSDALSGDFVADQPVLIEALLASESAKNVVYDLVVMLQPTSPLRKSSDVVGSIDKLLSTDAKACWTISRSDSKQHPLKQLIVSGDNLTLYSTAGANIIARQQLSPVYHRNGVAYVIERDALFSSPNLLPDPTTYFLVSTPQISIDTIQDVKYIEYLLAHNLHET